MTLILIRIFDIFLATVGLLVLFPMMLLIFLLCLLETGQPLFKQERLGRNQVPITILKFRTMALNTPSVATHLSDLTSVTPLGRFLRRTKLDELPQLWNVFKGDMGLVGPRPGLPNQVELTAARERLNVFVFRPGITGLAQLNRIDMSTPELLAQTDAQMISQISLKNYFKYIFLTLIGEGIGDSIKS